MAAEPRPPGPTRATGATSAGAGARLQARGLTWVPLGRRRPVLDHVDLLIEPGEKVLVVGSSGAGKSTLLRALAGVLDVVEPGELTGQVLVDGAPARAGDGRVGLLVQDPADARVAATIGRDVAFGPENLGLPRAEIHRRVAWALEAVGLPYGVAHPSSALSGGEAQRLALAGVLALGPRALLLDEPTAMLDADSAGAVRRAVGDVVAASGATLVVVEHRIEGWAQVVDRLVVLGRDGVVVADGPVAAVLAERGAELAAAGVWVPGVPAPAPENFPPELAAPWPVPDAAARESDPPDGAPAWAPGAPLLAAADVSVIRRPRRRLRVVRDEAAHDTSQVVALDGVSTQVRAGRALALRGASGAGKSTLLGVLLGLDAPTSGRVTAAPGFAPARDDRPHRWRSAELAARVGWVPQRAELTVTSTESVRASLLATPRALGRLDAGSAADRRAALIRIDDLLDALGLARLAKRNPYRLSGGEMRRLAVAGALAHGPAVVGLDEPTVGQDRITWAAVAGLVRAARDGGCGVVASTHDDALAALCDDVLPLRAGRAAGVAP